MRGEDQIEATLRLTLGYVHAAAPSPRQREYRMRAESYARVVVEGWKTLPPSQAQRAALGEIVVALHSSVLSSARTGSLRAMAQGETERYRSGQLHDAVRPRPPTRG